MQHSFVIGDRLTDVKLADNLGCKALWINNHDELGTSEIKGSAKELAGRTVIAYGAGGKQLAQYPATIGDSHDPLPIGHLTITGVVHYPWYNYDPEHFWNPDPKQAKAVLPPGPNSPAGAAWLGLSKEHYGIHGTPDPGHVRHGESAGCIRLTNWDVDNLSRMVRSEEHTSEL